MSITLNKGQTISLEKTAPGLTKVFMGLGWDPVGANTKKKGFFASLLGGNAAGAEIDLDASVIVMDAGKKVIDTVSFSSLKSRDGAIKHGGDNRTGAGDGDDEVIYVDLMALSQNAAHLVFTVNAFTGQTFNEVDNAVARLVNDANGAEICSFTLKEQGAHTGVIMASLSKTANGWQMTAHGVAGAGRTVRSLEPQAQSLV